MPPTLQVVAQGRTLGEQNIHTAELSAILAMCQVVSAASVVSESFYALRKAPSRNCAQRRRIKVRSTSAASHVFFGYEWASCKVRVEKDQGSPSNTEVASVGPSSDSSVHIIVLCCTFARISSEDDTKAPNLRRNISRRRNLCPLGCLCQRNFRWALKACLIAIHV